MRASTTRYYRKSDDKSIVTHAQLVDRKASEGWYVSDLYRLGILDIGGTYTIDDVGYTFLGRAERV